MVTTVECEITDIDYWENDALLKINGVTFYFQFEDNTRPPTIDEALQWLKNDIEELQEKAWKLG